MNRLFTKCLAGGVALAIVVSASVALAVPTYLDLGADGTPGGATWNQLGDWTVGSIADLLDSAGSSTGVGVSVTDGFNFENTSGGDWAGVPVPWAVAGATNDSFFTNGSNGSHPTGAITFTGLTVGGLYDFSVISSRNASGSRTGTLTLGGADSDNGNSVEFDAFVDGFSANELQIWTDATPDGAGSLTLLMTSTVPGFSYLNAVSLELVGMVPEPSSMALLGIGMVSMLLRRRRS